MARHEKSDRELLEDIYDFLNGTLEKRGLVSRVEMIERWKLTMIKVSMAILGIVGSGTAGYLTYLMVKHGG